MGLLLGVWEQEQRVEVGLRSEAIGQVVGSGLGQLGQLGKLAGWALHY